MSLAKRPSRIIAIDFGMVRIGLAVSDTSLILATPVGVVQGTKKVDQTVKNVVEAIRKLEKDYDSTVSEIVIGLPLMMNGTVGLLADEVKNFADKLGKAVDIPIKLWDERLTSVQAERALRESGLSRKKRTQHVDYVAAVVILQSYLDHLAFVRQQTQ